MPTSTLLLIVLLPLELLIVVTCIVLVVAVVRARPEDLPDLLRIAGEVLRQLAKQAPRLPQRSRRPRDNGSQPDDEEDTP